MTKAALTKREATVLHAIEWYFAEHAYAPSLQDVVERTGIKSKGNVSEVIGRLVKKGILDRGSWGSHRDITVLQPHFARNVDYMRGYRDGYARAMAEVEKRTVDSAT